MTRRVSVQLDQRADDLIAAAAVLRGCSRAAVVRALVTAGVDGLAADPGTAKLARLLSLWRGRRHLRVLDGTG